MEFGNKVQMLRKNHNISQETLASILNINRNHLSRIETGKSEPTLSIIRDVANYFRVDVASLMDMDDKKMNTKEKINAIDEGCHHLIDSDLNTLLRLISVMREEYVKKGK
ncbi:MAG: helix-turn-helix transcriptional regulator [Bacilli bacterium]|nr:helix-turn-helix transcriptional regulator [Bacilli bacterium]